MRLFIGIELPDEIKDHIASYLAPVKITDKGWEKSHDYHQTLIFIGETDEQNLELIKERLDAFRFESFYLGLNDFEFFPRRILYLSLLPSEDLLSLKRNLDILFPEWGKHDSKPFLPHITVKRWQRYEFNQLQEGLRKSTFPSRDFKVKYISLFKSEKDEFNNKYHVIHRSPSN